MLDVREDPNVLDLFAKSFGKLPPEELYAIHDDPAQMKNLADQPQYQEIKNALSKRLQDYQIKTNDPRVHGLSPWDDYPFYAGDSFLKGKYLEEVKALRQSK